ncbi:DNA-binding protein [Nonlabens mediterrranea]|uniref:DNA-binding protein n=1 Tax=Nonlabens mediterrranea TaxID=1419947 RepID=A0ABS0A5T3_9FLAO|nr:DNA-binding protein [Nonlabens mediterrranea]
MDFNVGDQVNLIIVNETPLGYTVMIDGVHEGLLYRNEVYVELEDNSKHTGYIKNIREDGKIDVSLRPQGFLNVIDSDVDKVMSLLNESPYGYLLLTDKSPPDHIRYHLNMSKKAYKKALGHLYKQKLITISEEKVELVKKK